MIKRFIILFVMFLFIAAVLLQDAIGEEESGDFSLKKKDYKMEKKDYETQIITILVFVALAFLLG